MKDEKKRRSRDEDGSPFIKKKRCDDLGGSSSSKQRSHIPMSERQQFALLKQMETASTDEKAMRSILTGGNSPHSERDSPRIVPTGVSGGSSTSSSSSSCSSTSCRSNISCPTIKSKTLSTLEAGFCGRSQRERSASATSNVTGRKSSKRNSTGETALIKLAKKGDIAGIKAIVKEGVNVNERDYAGWTALHECSIRNHARVVAYLLKHGADPNLAGMNGDTALHDAAKHGHVKVVRYLLRHNADSSIVNAQKERPVDVALTDEIRSVLRQSMQPKSSNHDSFLPKTELESDASCSSTSSGKIPAKSGNVTPQHSNPPNAPVSFRRATPSIATPLDVDTSDLAPRVKSASKKDPYAFDENEDEAASSANAQLAISQVSGANTSPSMLVSPSGSIGHRRPPSRPDLEPSPTGTGPPLRLRFSKEAAGQYTLLEQQQKLAALQHAELEELSAAQRTLSAPAAPCTAPLNVKTEQPEDLPTRRSSAPHSVEIPSTPAAEEAATGEEGEQKVVPPLRIKLGTPEAGAGEPSSADQAPGDPQTAVDSAAEAPDVDSTPAPGSQPGLPSSSLKSDEHKIAPAEQDSFKTDRLSTGSVGQGRHRSGRTLRSHTAALREKEEKGKSAYNNTPLKKRKLRSRTDGSQSEQEGEGSATSTSGRLDEESQQATCDSLPTSAGPAAGNGASGGGFVSADETGSSQGQQSSSSFNEDHSFSFGASSALLSVNMANASENPYEKALALEKSLRAMILRMVEVQPKAPYGFPDYLLSTKQYLLADRLPANLSPRPPPTGLFDRVLLGLFMEQEKERHVQVLKHQSEREQLRLSAEQAVLRAHTRAALALGSHPRPLSFCSVFDLEGITYLPANRQNEHRDEENVRDRFTPRTFIGWLQDIKDSFSREKKKMLCRQLHEAESLMMVQKLDWEMKVREAHGHEGAAATAAAANSSSMSIMSAVRNVSSSFVPLVEVPEDFPLFVHDPVSRITA